MTDEEMKIFVFDDIYSYKYHFKMFERICEFYDIKIYKDVLSYELSISHHDEKKPKPKVLYFLKNIRLPNKLDNILSIYIENFLIKYFKTLLIFEGDRQFDLETYKDYQTSNKDNKLILYLKINDADDDIIKMFKFDNDLSYKEHLKLFSIICNYRSITINTDTIILLNIDINSKKLLVIESYYDIIFNEFVKKFIEKYIEKMKYLYDEIININNILSDEIKLVDNKSILMCLKSTKYQKIIFNK